jgi:hypothetical protein
LGHNLNDPGCKRFGKYVFDGMEYAADFKQNSR